MFIGLSPRVRAASTEAADCSALGGLSPRVRGSPPAALLEDTHSRSIPASAGQPLRFRSGETSAAVYPRECGAAAV